MMIGDKQVGILNAQPTCNHLFRIQNLKVDRGNRGLRGDQFCLTMIPGYGCAMHFGAATLRKLLALTNGRMEANLMF